MKRLSRKEKRRRGEEENVVDNNQKERPHVSFSDVTVPSSTPSSTCPSKLPGPARPLLRQSLLQEEGLGHSHGDPVCSRTGFAANPPVSGSRSVLLHHNAERDQQPSSLSSPYGQSSGHLCV